MSTITNELFVSPDEREVDRIEITSASKGATIGKDHLILTNKRLYYKGAAMALDNSAQFAQGEAILDTASITGTYFSVMRNIFLLVLGVLFALAGLALLSAAGPVTLLLTAFGIGVIALAIFAAPKVLVIHYHGSSLKIMVKGISVGASVANFQRFCKNIHAAAEARNAALEK